MAQNGHLISMLPSTASRTAHLIDIQHAYFNIAHVGGSQLVSSIPLVAASVHFHRQFRRIAFDIVLLSSTVLPSFFVVSAAEQRMPTTQATVDPAFHQPYIGIAQRIQNED